MKYEVDHDYPFCLDEHGVPFLPANMTEDGDLYILDNGKYLPSGAYRTEDGGYIIYEPHQLSPYADMLADLNADMG